MGEGWECHDGAPRRKRAQFIRDSTTAAKNGLTRTVLTSMVGAPHARSSAASP